MLPNTNPGVPLQVVVLMPLRDDWASAAELIRRLDQAVGSYPCTMTVLLVDDGSVEACPFEGHQYRFGPVRTIRVLRLHRNLGHQRAIAVGLAHVQQAIPCDALLVMDADGEDTADGALELIRSFAQDHQCTKAVFAARSRRMESLWFRTFYLMYRGVHLVLTGVSVRVGNFSILPSSYLNTLVVTSELWNHYAAAVFRSGLPLATTPIPRGHRFSGASKMDFISLAAHGMSAISVFGDVVGVRVMLGAITASLLAALGILIVTIIRIFTDKAVPGWATYSIGGLIIILLQMITIAASFTFTMLSNRINLSFVPARDYVLFVAEYRDIYRND